MRVCDRCDSRINIRETLFRDYDRVDYHRDFCERCNKEVVAFICGKRDANMPKPEKDKP